MRAMRRFLTAALLAASCTAPTATSSPAVPSASASIAPSITPSTAPATPSPTAPARSAVSGLGPDIAIALEDGPVAPSFDGIAFARAGRELVVRDARGERVVYRARASAAGLMIRPDGYANGRVAFIEVANTMDDPTRVLTMNAASDAAPTVLDSIPHLFFAGGGPWPEEPRPMTNGYQVLWLRRVEANPNAYVLMRSLDGDAGTEVFRSSDPFLFTTSWLGDVVIATQPLDATATARLIVVDKTGAPRQLAERPAGGTGVPVAVADRYGWSEGLIERHVTTVENTPPPTTAVELWHVFTAERTRVDLGCALAGATTRHLVARCGDHIVLSDVATGTTATLPRLTPADAQLLVVSRSALLRGLEPRMALLTVVTAELDVYPSPAPTVLWSANRAPSDGRWALYLYYAAPPPLGMSARLVDASGALVASGAVLGSGVFGPQSCAARISGQLQQVFVLSDAQIADLTAHPSAYRFEIQFAGSWRALTALDSRCRTTLAP